MTPPSQSFAKWYRRQEGIRHLSQWQSAQMDRLLKKAFLAGRRLGSAEAYAHKAIVPFSQ
jgi:hypothetical protein